MSDDERIREGSGNVFADLSLDVPEEEMAKAQLVAHIADILAERSLTQVQAAHILGVSQPKISALLNGHTEGFSLERLFRLLHALDVDVVISLARASDTYGRLRVIA